MLAEAAVAAIAVEGLEGVKLSQIARAAGVTTGAVVHYFESKDDVLLAALERLAEGLIEKLADPTPDGGLEGFYDVLPGDAEALGEWKVWLAFWGRAAFVPRLAAVHRDYYRAIEARLGDLIGGDAEEARLTASAIIAAIDGIGTRVCLEPELWPPERQRAVLARLIEPLLTPAKGTVDA